MTSITDGEFEDLLQTFERSAVHLETRDAYGTEIEIPYMAMWARGEHDDLEWLQGWAATLRRHIAEGKTVQRARVVSEPLSDYQRWSHSIAHVMVDAGEDIRWVPRPLTSGVLMPGNDFYVFDDETVVFLHYAGSGLGVDKVKSTDPDDVARCLAAFADVWKLAIRHSDYSPV